jgi:hypothetical protein
MAWGEGEGGGTADTAGLVRVYKSAIFAMIMGSIINDLGQILKHLARIFYDLGVKIKKICVSLKKSFDICFDYR